MRNNISGAQAYRNALRQQYQQQVNAAVQQIAAQRAAGQQAMGNTYQQLKPTVQDNLGGFAGAIDTYNKNIKAELEAQQKAEQAAQKAWAAQAVKDIKAARKSTTSTKSTVSTKAAADAASEEISAAENSDSLFGTPGKESNSKPEKEDEAEKKPGLLAKAGNAIKNGAVNIRNSMKETANDRQQKRIQEAENHKVNKADELDAARQAAAQNNRDLIQKKNLTQNDKNVIFQRYNNWIQQGNNRDIVDALNAIDEIKNEQQSEVQGAGWNKNALEQKLSQYSKNDIDLANEYRAMYNRIPGYRVSDRTWNTAIGVGKTILSAPMQAVDYAGQTFDNAVASLNNEEYRNAVKQQNSALLKMQTMEDQGLAYAYNEKGQVLGETQQYKALREQFENAKALTDNLSSVINQPVSKESKGYQMYQSGQENLMRSDMGLSDAQKFVKGAATGAAENIAIAAVNPALVVPVLSAQGSADSFAQSTANEESSFTGLVKGAAKGIAAYAINSVGVEQMLDTMGIGGARNTIASKVVQYLKNDSVLSGFAKSNPALYAVLMGTTDNGLQSFAETWADYAIDLATNTAEPKSMEQLLQESLQSMASGATGGAMTAVAGLGVNAGRQALYNKVAGNAETAQQNVQTEAAETVADNRAPAEQNTTGQNTAVQDVINNLTTGENGGNGNTNRTAKAFYLNVSPETAQKNAENRAALAAALGVDESALPTNNKEMRQFIQGLKPDNFGKTNNYVGEIDAMMEQKQQENAEIRDNSWNGENLSGEISKMAGITANNKEADRAVETMRKSWISDEAESLYRSSNQAGDPAFTRAFEQAYRSGLDGNAQNKNTAAYAMAGEQAMDTVDKAYQQGRADRIARNHADAAEFVPGEVLNAKHNKDLLFVEKPKDNGAQRAGKIVEKIAKAQGNRNVFWVEDAPFNGKKDGSGNIYLNANLSSGEAVRTYFGHEITHIAENSKFYKDLSKFIQDSETGKEWVRQRGFDSFDEYAEAKYRIYSDKADQTGNESYRLASMDEAMQEVVADWCGENLLGNSAISERAIRELCGENRSFATKVKDFLADMVERFFGTSEEDELRHALDLFEKALGESNKKAAVQDGDEKFKVVDGYRSDILGDGVRGQETANSNSISTDSKAETVVSDKNGNAVAEHIRSKDSDIRYSVSEPDTISKKNRELARQNQKLTEQNERLKTTIGILKGEFKRSAGHKIADQSMNRLVSRLKGQNKSTIEREVLKQKLTKLFDYVQNAETNELNFDDVMDVTADIAKDILSNSRDTGESLRESDTRYQELYKNIGTVEVTAEEKSRIEAAYGKAQFGKINGIKIKVVDKARSLGDVLHNDLAASYPEFFSGDISTAEDVFDRMAQVRSALNDPVLDNDSGMSFDEMAYSLAQQIWDEYMDMPDTRAKTYADKQADKFKAAKEEFRAQLESQRAEAKAEYEQSLKTVQRENAAAIEQVRGETIGLRKRLAKANQELADLNKRAAAQEKTIGKQAEKIDKQTETIAENKQKMRDLRSESKEAEKAARRNINTAYDFGVADQRAVGDAKIAAKKKQIEKLKADIKDRQQKMRDLRSEKNQKILETRAKYRGMMDKQRENRAKTELRNKIKKNGMSLASALAKPTKSKYVPKELVRTAADLCDIIESTARAGKSRGTQYQQKLADLRTLYTQMKNSKDFDISSEYQADVDDMIQELNQKALSRNPNARTADTVTEVKNKVLSAGQFADRSLNDLTTSELAMLNNVISAINNTISKAGQAHTKAYTLSLSETRTKAANEVKAGHRLNPKNKAEQAITNQFLNYMTPLRLFRYIGGYSENGAVQQMYNSLNDAAVETSAIELKGNSFFSDIASDSKNLSKFSGSGADKIKLQTRNETLNDVEVEVTPAIMANMLDVWAHNPEEVERSGFVIPDLALYHKGMTKQAYANGTVIKPSAEQWLQWSADSTMYGDYAKQWSKALSEQNAYIAPKMRKTQMDIQGFTNIGEGDHRTLYRDKSYVKGTTEIVGGGKTLVHDGFTKNRVEGARQPLYAMDITEFAKKTVHDTSVFAGMSAALLDFSRIYDGPVFTGQVDMEGAPISNKTLAGMIEQQYTPAATNYIKNLLDDIREQPRADQSAALGKLLGNVASASLSMNVIGTPIKQSPSFYAASSVIGLKPLLKTNAQLTKQYAITPEEIMQYTPLLALRNEQGGSQELAALKRGTGKIAGFTAKLPGTKLISWVDMHTVKALWAASADYVHSQNASLDVDSAEFKREVAKVFNRCVQETQPNYSTLQRSEMQRSGNAFYRILGQFKTQPIQNGNILLDAYLNMKSNKGSKAASKKFGQALAGQTLSLVAFVALGNLGRLIMHQFKYWTDPDKEEVTAEQVAKAFGSDALSSVLGMIPGGTEALEIVQGYDYSNVTTSFINDFVDSSKRVYDNFPKIFDEELSDAEREAAKNKVLKGAAKIIDLTGLPASTTVRLADALNGWYKDITSGELNSQQKPTESVQKARLYNAYMSGDEKQRTLAYDSLIGMGVRENEINSAMMTKLGSEDDMKQAAQQLADNFLESDDKIEAVISKYADLGFSEYLVRNKVRSMADSIVSKETEESKYEILDNTMDYLESNDIYNWLGEEDRAAVQQSVSADAAKMAKQQAGYEQKYSEGEKYLAKVSGGDSDAYMKLRAAYIAANRKATAYGKSDNDFKNFYNAVTGSSYSKSLKSALLQAKNGNSKLVDASADQILAYYGSSTQADTDGNSRVSQDEFKDYVQKSGMSRSAAAYVWSIRWPKSSNPYL